MIGTYYFQDYVAREDFITSLIQSDSNRFFLAVDHGVALKRFDGPMLHSVAKSIRQHKNIVDKIENLNDEDLDTFLGVSKVFIFESHSAKGIDAVLFGLSSFDGTRAYIRKQHLEYTDLSVPQKLLEHELMHNLSRWRKKDPRRIAPSNNANLIIRGSMVEAGDFYEHSVYQEPCPDPCPFCLSESKKKRY